MLLCCVVTDKINVMEFVLRVILFALAGACEELEFIWEVRGS